MPSFDGDAASSVFGKLSHGAIERADAYRLLSVGFADPRLELAAALVDGSFQADVIAAAEYLDPEGRSSKALRFSLEESNSVAATKSAEEMHHSLKVEYARLFLVPGSLVSPYESAYHDYTMFPQAGSTAAVARAALHEAGLDTRHGRPEPADHIASECEFMFYLCHEEAGAWWRGDTDEAKQWRRREHVFMTEHLESFALKFCQRLDEAEVAGFYAMMMDLTRLVIRSKVAV